MADPGRHPRWIQGTYAALAVLVLGTWAVFLMTTAWVDGVLASGATGRIEGNAVFLPWSRMFVDQAATLSFGMQINPPAILLPVALAFLLASRSWRLLHRRPATPAASGIPNR